MPLSGICFGKSPMYDSDSDQSDLDNSAESSDHEEDDRKSTSEEECVIILTVSQLAVCSSHTTLWLQLPLEST
jgi:hypothetical protein